MSKSYDWVKSLVLGAKDQADTIKAQTADIQARAGVENETVKALAEQEALLTRQLETEDIAVLLAFIRSRHLKPPEIKTNFAA